MQASAHPPHPFVTHASAEQLAPSVARSPAKSAGLKAPKRNAEETTPVPRPPPGKLPLPKRNAEETTPVPRPPPGKLPRCPETGSRRPELRKCGNRLDRKSTRLNSSHLGIS